MLHETNFSKAGEDEACAGHHLREEDLRKVVPVDITRGFCSAGGPHNPAGRALLQSWQQQATQVGMPKEVCADLGLQDGMSCHSCGDHKPQPRCKE